MSLKFAPTNKEEKFEKAYPELTEAFKKQHIDICPNCDRPTNVVPNPFYYHKCEHCDWTGSYLECKSKTTKDFVKEIIEKYYE